MFQLNIYVVMIYKDDDKGILYYNKDFCKFGL